MLKADKLTETEMLVIPNLSLTRQISIEDIKWAILKGFEAGEEFVKGGIDGQNV